jgi:hypothetical protein
MSQSKRHGLEESREVSGSELPPIERRPNRRNRVFFAGIIVYADGVFTLDCTIRDLSENGARLTVLEGAQFPSNFFLINIRGRVVYEAVVVWIVGAEVGVSFGKIHRLTDMVDPTLKHLKRLWLARAVR